MRFTKKIMTMAACAMIAATSMVGMGVSAAEIINEEQFIISEFEKNTVIPYADSKKALTITGYEQENTKWCWAACIQSMLDYYGVSLSQEDIVKEAKGTETAANVTGTTAEIKAVLNAHLDKTFTSSKLTFSGIKTRIDKSNPVILIGTEKSATATSDHALICYGYNTNSLYTYDPWTGEEKDLACSSDRATEYTYDNGTCTYTLASAVYTNS